MHHCHWRFLLVSIALLQVFINASEHLSCDPLSDLAKKIASSDLIVSGRILKSSNNDAVILVLKILKGYQIISELRGSSHKNDYHVIIVTNVDKMKNCHSTPKDAEDFVFYLKKTQQANFFEYYHSNDFGDGFMERKILSFLNGAFSRHVQQQDPCIKLNCQFGATCTKWPSNPPKAVCHCATTSCSPGIEETKICGSDGTFYQSECHLKRQQCILQRSIVVSPKQICNGLLDTSPKKTLEDQQNDNFPASDGTSCRTHKCPPYAKCVGLPYPHCRCPTDKCSPSSPLVCGTDEITYTNICELQKVSCKANRYIKQQYVGKCDMCKFIKCEFNGVCEMTEEGTGTRCKCQEPENVCDSRNQVQVCGSDDVTYPTECHLTIASCRQKRQLMVVQKGPCLSKIYSDLCSQKQCWNGAKCLITTENSLTVAKCSCEHITCAADLSSPVCGDDGETYSNKCFMQRAACQKQRPIKILYQGNCEHNPCLRVKCPNSHEYCRVDVNGKGVCVCPDSCPNIVQPVCGSDNTTYDSVCHLVREACSTKKSLWVIYNGVCSEEPRCIELDFRCSEYQICRSDMKQTRCECPTCPDTGIGEHVCGTDGNTYRSECHLRNTACVSHSKSLKVAHIGTCDACKNKKCSFYAICRMNRFGEPQCICPTDCTYIQKPVCGSDQRTYENLCYLKVISCADNRPITMISEGPCKTCTQDCPLGEMCSNGKCVCTDKCSPIASQVCGSDGMYYKNECELKRHACLEKKTITSDHSEASCRYFSSDASSNPNNENKDKYYNHPYSKCNCNERGSLNSQCDKITKRCECKTGVTGDECNKCKPGYWQFSDTGCTACSCNKFGSESIQCNSETGECICKPLAFGKYCSVCPLGYTMSSLGCIEKDKVTDNTNSEIGFLKESFIKSYWTGNAELTLLINITLIPSTTDGIIFYVSDTDRSKDFLSLVVKDRYIEFRFDLGSGALLIKSQNQLTIGKLHNIVAERFERHARLVIDETDIVYGESPKSMTKLDTGPMFYLGQPQGLKTNVLSHTGQITDGLVGCIKSMKIFAGQDMKEYLINEQASWMMESSNIKPECPSADFTPDSKVVEDPNEITDNYRQELESHDYCETQKPCQNGGLCTVLNGNIYNCECKPGYQGHTCNDSVSPIWKLMDGSYAMLDTEQLHLNRRLKIDLKFLPTNGQGLIMFISDNQGNNPNYLHISLNKNHVEVVCKTQIGVTRARSKEPVHIGKWNYISVLKAVKYISLDLNSSPNFIKKRLSSMVSKAGSHIPRELMQIQMRNRPIFFGGVTETVNERFAPYIQLSPNFNGAIQKITINDINIQLQDPAVYLQNISQWQGSPCGTLHNPCPKDDPERSYCIPDMDRATCFCNPHMEHLCQRNMMQQDNPTIGNINRRFLGGSVAKYTSTKNKRVKSFTKNRLRIKFKTNSADGALLIMKNAYTAKKHFLVIAIRNAVIEVSLNLGGSNGLLRITSNINISDNNWHTVEFTRSNRKVSLLVDSYTFMKTMTMDPSFNVLNTDGWIWLGGTKKRIDGFPWEYNKKFIGCVSELYVNEMKYHLMSESRENIGPVLDCKEF